MKLRIAYCDDEMNARQIFGTGILDAFSRQDVSAALADYADPLQLAAALREGAVFDAVFLDIDMPGLDGISLAKMLAAQEPAPPAILFLSNKDELVFRALQVRPLRFLRKTYFEAEIDDAVGAVLRHLQRSANVVFQDGKDLYQFPLEDIRYAEVLNQTLTVVLAQRRVSFRYTISAAEEQLAPAGFLRIHKSYLVNYRAIARIQKDHVLLIDGQRLPLSKHRYPDVISRFMACHRRDSGFLDF